MLVYSVCISFAEVSVKVGCKIFFQAVACLLILVTVYFTDRTFLMLIKLSFSWIQPSVMYLKSHLHTQGHVGCVLCYLLELYSFAFFI